MQHLDRLSSAAQSLLWLFLPFLSSQFCGIYRVREEVWELRLGWNTECHMQKCPRDPKGFLMQALEQLPQSIRNLRQWPGLSNPSDFCRADSPVPIAQRRYRTSSREAERPKKSSTGFHALEIQSPLCRTTPWSFGRRSVTKHSSSCQCQV